MERLNQPDSEAGSQIPCPDETEWLYVAAGLVSEAKGQALLDHAGECERCGALLKKAAEDLNPPVLSEAASALSGEFRKKAAAAMLAEHRVAGGRGGRRRAPVLALVGIAAAVIVSIFVVGRTVLLPEKPEALVAKAFEVTRPWNVRFPGAAYSEVNGSAQRGEQRSYELSAAETAILEPLKREPQNPRLIQLRCRVELLRRQYSSAIDSLLTLSQGDSPPPGIELDLGTAYLAEGIDNPDDADFGKAVEHLSKAIKAAPGDPVPLFNRAVAAEAMSMWGNAESDWTQYLSLDPTGGWADEAREHLKNISQKKTPGVRN